MTDDSLFSQLSFGMTIAFATALVAGLLLKFWLATRQIRHVALHRGAVPAGFASRITLEAHQKAADYTLVLTRFGMLELAWGAALVLAWTLLGGLSWLNQELLQWFQPGLTQQVALLLAFTAAGMLLDLPFGLY